DRRARRRPHCRAGHARRAPRDESRLPRHLRAWVAGAAVRGRGRGARVMRIWQPGGNVSVQRPEVDDWSWRRTRRRIAALARFSRPYKVRTALSVASLLAATATALAPPFLAKYAVDDGIRKHELGKLWWIVVAFLVAGLLNWAMSYAQTYLTGWVGERI